MPDSRKPTAADHAWAEEQARQIEAAMPEAVEGEMNRDLLTELVQLAEEALTIYGPPMIVGEAPAPERRLALGVLSLRAALSRAEAESPVWKATHQHYKGGLYMLRHEGQREHDGERMAVYEDDKRRVFVRPMSEFTAKFTPLAAGLSSSSAKGKA